MVTNAVTAFEAKNRLGWLLDRVEAGQEVIITRHGEPVAKLVPVTNKDDGAIDVALETFRDIRQSLAAKGVKTSRGEVRQWINEGRR